MTFPIKKRINTELFIDKNKGLSIDAREKKSGLRKNVLLE